MNGERPTSTRDLVPSELSFVAAMQRLGFGRFEFLRIERGELVLDPWPTTIRDVKFGTTDSARFRERPAEFELKQQAAEFFEHVRAVDDGDIRTLEIHNGLPFSMEIEHRRESAGERHA
jgi:hypothetical protein